MRRKKSTIVLLVMLISVVAVLFVSVGIIIWESIMIPAQAEQHLSLIFRSPFYYENFHTRRKKS